MKWNEVLEGFKQKDARIFELEIEATKSRLFEELARGAHPNLDFDIAMYIKNLPMSEVK